MEKIGVNLEEVLSDCECHFNWDLEKYEEYSFSDPKLEVAEYIKRYNHLEPHKFIRRFRNSLFLAYIMYRDGLDGWDKMLENGFRIMESTRNPIYPEGLNQLPSYGDSEPLYTGPLQEFFAYEDMDKISVGNKAVDHDATSDENDHEERIKDDESFTGLYVACEHVFYSLKASILFRVGSSPNEVLELLSCVVHKDDMTQADRAALLCTKATTIRNCGQKGLDAAMDILKMSILTDPDNFRWPLVLIHYSGEKRRMNWGQAVDKSEILSVVQMIDSVLQHDLEPGMRVRYQFDKFQALNEICRGCKDKMSAQELTKLYQNCNELNEIIIRTSEEPNILAYCAQFMSKNFREISKAIRVIEKVLEKRRDNVYVNAKASNIYKKGGQLDKALECAESAALAAFGSCWQVFDLKLALKHDFDYEEFFGNVNKNYPQDEYVKVTHKIAALFYSIRGDFPRALSHFKVLLDTCDSDDEVYGEAYCSSNNKRVHTAEAAYNVALLMLCSDFEENDNERTGNEGLCVAIRKEIEERFDLDDFKYTGTVTPKQYVEWLRRKCENGVRDKGPSAASMRYEELGNKFADYHGRRQAEGESSSNYQYRGSARHQNRYSVHSEPSSSRHFGENRFADNQNQNYFGNRSEYSGDRSRRSALQDKPSKQGQDRLSEWRDRNESSAKNMANYFERLESSAENTLVGSVKTRPYPQSDDMYSRNNQGNYNKPELPKNWRTRSDSTGETRNAVQSSHRRSSDNKKWRERDD